MYDPRPISEGGNRGAGDRWQLRAPKGKFRVVSVDTFDGGDSFRDFDTFEEADQKAKGGSMLMEYVYDEHGTRLVSRGSF